MPPADVAPVADERREGAADAMGGGRRRLPAALVVRAGRAPSRHRRRQDPRRSNPIDAFVRARLEPEGLAPAPPAPRELLIRRLAFDLTGLPPTLAEIDAFRRRSIARRLRRGWSIATWPRRRTASGWRWTGSIWRATPTPTATRPTSTATCRRTATGSSSAFNRNLPYDQFLTWQLAGDLLPDATREQRIATAFNRLHRQTNEGGSIEEEFRTEYVADRVNTFGTRCSG